MKKKTVNSKYLNSKWTTGRVKKEIDVGLKLLNKIHQPIISFLGSHKSKPSSKHYKHAYRLGKELAQEGYAIVTGGGPGIMHAGNLGAYDAKGTSIGIKAVIHNERVTSKIYTDQSTYHFLFVRRFILSLKSDALIFYPGGYGTLNELFEYIVLMQINYIDQVPIICVDRKYWEGLFKWLNTVPRKHGYYIDQKRDLKLVQFADTVEEVKEILKKTA